MHKILLRITAFICLISAAGSLSGCSDNSETAMMEKNDETTSETQTLKETVTQSPVSVTETPETEAAETSGTEFSGTKPEPTGIMKASPEYFPVRTDGSTSSIAIDAAVKAAYIGGFSGKDLEPFITHSKTYAAFEKLVSGQTDAIYTVPLSERQIEYAQENDFMYESVPAAREAFVFIVNADNPVDSLTSDQIRKIYSGEIVNWSEVGGNDDEISLYTRNPDSGSGSYFRDFMGDTVPAEGNRVYTAGTMGSILESVADYDNGIGSIGYSVYSFVKQMYPDSSGLKMISVDGIEPTRENIINETYPLSSCTYFIFSADEPADSEVRKLAEFIGTEKAQSAVEEAGYMRIR